MQLKYSKSYPISVSCFAERGCAAMTPDGKWIPKACYMDLPYVCEKGEAGMVFVSS